MCTHLFLLIALQICVLMNLDPPHPNLINVYGLLPAWGVPTVLSSTGAQSHRPDCCSEVSDGLNELDTRILSNFLQSGHNLSISESCLAS